MTSKKVAAVLAERRIAANDNTSPTINPRDVAIADRGHRLGDMENGIGYTDFEPHPYRRGHKQTVSRYAAVNWPARKIVAANDNIAARSRNIEDPIRRRQWLAEELAIAFEEKAEPHRRRLAVLRAIDSPDASKDMRREAEKLAPSVRDRKSAAEGFPIAREFNDGRIDNNLRAIAADVRDCYEAANAPEVSAMALGERGSAVGIIHRVHAVQACQLVRYRTMHLWRPLIDAVVFGKTMKDIGIEYGGNKEDAPKLGRQKIIDALLLAKEVFADLRAFAREDDAALEAKDTLQARHAYALGRKATDLPVKINVAANQNMRSIAAVA